MKKKIKEVTVSTDIDTLNKLRGKLKPTDKVNLVDKKVGQTNTSSTTPSSYPTTAVSEDAQPETTIEPKDKETIKYLSNVKDSKTGEMSKPFTIGAKKYQMVRGITPSKEIVMAVYCHDDLNKNGENIIHPVKHFEENIVKPFIKENGYNADNFNADEKDFHDKNNMEPTSPTTDKKEVKETGFDYASAENDFHDRESFMDYLNLADLVGFKHFFVDKKTGKVVGKFKNTKDMVKSGVQLGDNQDYMDTKALKRFRFGDYFKGKDVNEEAPVDGKDAGTNVPKLQADVKKLANLIKDKFSMYLSKLTKPVQQSQFLTAMAAEIGVPLSKLSGIISTYKDLAQDGKMDNVNAVGLKPEARVITKNELTESLNKKKVIKTIKIKNIK